MSSQEQFVSGTDGAPPRAITAPPGCPQCKTKMTVKQVSPVLFAADIDEVVFGCDGCGTQIKRAVKRT